ncbi:hypothetical protein D6825_01495 [Candidatus Woesearchaeota archaeon]|nr:MAG: hypothetical protein D6825_01495 [Candidatus Woesearchaeota archaeon]
MIEEAVRYLAYFITFSFLGWVVDTTYRSLISGHYAPRTYLPFISVVYGIGGTMLLILYKNTNYNLMEHTLIGGISVTILELISGIFCDKVLKRKLWDYSKNAYNLWGHVDVLHTIYWFGLAALLRFALPYLP